MSPFDLPQAHVYGAPDLPPVPTREHVCGVQMSFQGLTVNISTGPLAWFEAALCCLSAADRQIVYAAKHAAGDTHALIFYSAGEALYNEPGQPYQDYQTPPFATDAASFVALAREVIVAGFVPCIFFHETQAESMRLVPLAIAALQGAVDLTAYCLLVPGFDGVFYGWAPGQITAWGALARSLGAPYLGIEHNTAHIPLGNGPADYAPGGAMDAFDTILSEFDPWGAGFSNASPGDGVWQIAGRLLGPAYRRPADQTPGDDPHPPFYLTDSPRGPRYAVAFETDTYWWVRNRVTIDGVNAHRAYYRALGYRYVC